MERKLSQIILKVVIFSICYFATETSGKIPSKIKNFAFQINSELIALQRVEFRNVKQLVISFFYYSIKE